jgi:replicative DNA helicase
MSDITELPSNLSAEKAVLSAMMHSEKLFKQGLGEGIDDECFHFPTNQILFSTIKTQTRDENGLIDLITLIPYLNDVGMLTRAGGPGAVADVYTYAPGGQGWSGWVDSLREMKARRLGVIAAKALSEASDSTEAMQTVRDAMEAMSKAVSGQKRSQTGKQAIGVFSDTFRAAHGAGDIPGYSTGLPELDQICGGMKGGELWVMGAKPSRGKSVLIIQFACEFLLKGLPVALFSIEMTTNEIIGRIICYISKVDYGIITQPRRAQKNDLSRIKSACEFIASSKLYIDSSANQTMTTIEAEAQRIKDTNNGELAYVGIDYLQIIKSSPRSSRTREEEVAQNSAGCKQLAKHLNCPVVTATQLNEQNQTRESRGIEQDADALLFICDDGIKIGKMRNGRRDVVLPLRLNGAKQRFE